MPLNGGDIFAGYTIDRLLGAGAMGEVYLARHPRLARFDAIKVLPTALTSDDEYRVRFNREADVAAGLWNPHIVGVHDRGEFDGHLWIAMDFVDGSDAAQLLRTRPHGLATEDVLEIVDAVADALDFAHSRQLLHRDVKPANILLTSAAAGRRRVLLADFGIARKVDDVGLTATNMALGTVSYAAPEQLMGETLDGRADQYALAATAFQLLTGTELFPSTNSAVTISKHLSAEPPRLADTKPELAGLDGALRRALAKQPGQRFESCLAFAAALRNGAGQSQNGAGQDGDQQQTLVRPVATPEPQAIGRPIESAVERPPAPPAEPLAPQAQAWSAEPPIFAANPYVTRESVPPHPPYAAPDEYLPPKESAPQSNYSAQHGRGKEPTRASARPRVIAVVGIVGVVAAVSIAILAWPQDEDATSQPATSQRATTTSTAPAPQGQPPTDATTPAVRAPQPPPGVNPTIADYIRENGITETTVRRGDPGAPTIDLTIPDGWEDGGGLTPKWAYTAIRFADPTMDSDPPTITAVVSKLTGPVDTASIFDYAGGELKNLPGYDGSPGGISGKTLGGFEAFQIGGTYVRDGVKRLIAQKTVVIPSADGNGVYVLQLNANGTAAEADPLARATAAIDDSTTITP